MDKGKPLSHEEIGDFFKQVKSRPIIDKAKILAEANEYADVVVGTYLSRTKRELARQRIIVMCLMDEIERMQNERTEI